MTLEAWSSEPSPAAAEDAEVVELAWDATGACQLRVEILTGDCNAVTLALPGERLRARFTVVGHDDAPGEEVTETWLVQLWPDAAPE